MKFDDFVSTVGRVVWSGSAYETSSDGSYGPNDSGWYAEGGEEIAVVQGAGGYKVVTCSFSLDPWGPAEFTQEEMEEIASAPWLTPEDARAEAREIGLDEDSDLYKGIMDALGF